MEMFVYGLRKESPARALRDRFQSRERRVIEDDIGPIPDTGLGIDASLVSIMALFSCVKCDYVADLVREGHAFIQIASVFSYSAHDERSPP